MLNLLKSNRCSICYTERFVRECPRKKRKICWSCCNNLRCDANCPESCIYSAKSLESNPFPSFKTDSRAEAVDVLKKSIDFWVGRQNPHLDNNSPIKFAENSSKDMLTWLSGYQYPLYFPMAYLMQKLKLPYSQSDDLPDPESFAEQYLDAVIRIAYNELRILTVNTNPMDDLSIRYTEILQALPPLKQLTSFSTLHSGISEDGVTALVFVELNHKQDWTVVVSKSTGSWKIRQNIAGSPQAYFAQNNEYTMIAEALGKGDDAKAWELISANLKIYPDSSDLYYYRALYWQLVKQLDKAAVDFFNAAALDDGWVEPYFHLGALALNKPDYPSARLWFGEVNRLQPDNPSALNNLAACYAGEGNHAKAREIWEDMLKKFPNYELVKSNLERLNRE